ncbi:MAG TPA: aldehyde dehydrogenase family protein, partial [Chloroflexota bacterium]|nr:aldehyde dehydrogenase family protein [Chloroflexota bacterium]
RAVRSPVDQGIELGRFQSATVHHARQAIAAARAAFAGWHRLPYQERSTILRRVAGRLRADKASLAGLLGLEAGKPRLEAFGEVDEAADMITTYCELMEANHGFILQRPSMLPGERNVSVLKPFGVWGVISPFNFPIALATGMIAGALLTGNTVVFKPASATPASGLLVYRHFVEAGLPPGVLNFITGDGQVLGEEFCANRQVDGLAFTGSREVGYELYRRFARPPARPCITELGGKNPAIVTAKADLDLAVEGVLRSAFGYSGQKCSACSRVYVDRSLHDTFLARLTERARELAIGDPTERATFLGPLINERAVETYLGATAEARRDGKLLTGGNRLREGRLGQGLFVDPAVVGGLPPAHRLFREELFVPCVAVAPVDSLDEALALANDTEFGLCAGIYSSDEAEVQRFFDTIEAGVTYANRRGGATSGAWPGYQSFGGWKGSGSTGKGALGPHYLQQFLREQSQTVIAAP